MQIITGEVDGGPLSQTRKGNEKLFLLKHRRPRHSSLTRIGPRLWKTKCFSLIREAYSCLTIFWGQQARQECDAALTFPITSMNRHSGHPTTMPHKPLQECHPPSYHTPLFPLLPLGLIAINFSGMTGYCPGGHARLVARGSGGRG